MIDVTNIVDALKTAEGHYASELVDGLLDMIERKERHALPSRRIIVAVWNKEHGECYECGLPAAFVIEPTRLGLLSEAECRRCAVCAANAANDGESVRRIEELA